MRLCVGVECYRMTNTDLVEILGRVDPSAMANFGLVEIWGRVDPSTVVRMLRRAGRSAKLFSQFRECSCST